VTAIAAAAGAALALFSCLIRLAGGPTLYDRTLALNGVVMKVTVIAAAAGVLAARAAWVDVALAFVLALLVINVAVVKFFRTRTFQPPLARQEDA
jgi:multicomponent Na+:H+ antiporter subunit F